MKVVRKSEVKVILRKYCTQGSLMNEFFQSINGWIALIVACVTTFVSMTVLPNVFAYLGCDENTAFLASSWVACISPWIIIGIIHLFTWPRRQVELVEELGYRVIGNSEVIGISNGSK